MKNPSKSLIVISLVLCQLIPSNAAAFCGFYVGKADAKLFNKASQVAMVRHGNKTVISMLNDYQGELEEFALVVPVPEILKEGQIHIGNKLIFDHLDAFTSPRLVEYFDPNPCSRYKYEEVAARLKKDSPRMQKDKRGKSLGVTVEAEYTVGEYDIVILSAKESAGLETWLIKSGYNIPKGASKALKPYITLGMNFFVAKVNLEEQKKTGALKLRPLQFAFETEKFMLPIRLGMINADGPQDLVVYVLTKTGRVETTNYRTFKLPTGMDIPIYIKNEFSNFYKAMFAKQVQKENGRAVFTEYFWNMSWCDPCASDPLPRQELKELGVFWLDDNGSSPFNNSAQQVMVTRLHVRYEQETFPEDLVFQETKDQENYQARYVLRHPWTGEEAECDTAKTYNRELVQRQEKEAATLANLTGWDIGAIRNKMNIRKAEPLWWDRLWK